MSFTHKLSFEEDPHRKRIKVDCLRVFLLVFPSLGIWDILGRFKNLLLTRRWLAVSQESSTSSFIQTKLLHYFSNPLSVPSQATPPVARKRSLRRLSFSRSLERMGCVTAAAASQLVRYSLGCAWLGNVQKENITQSKQTEQWLSL